MFLAIDIYPFPIDLKKEEKGRREEKKEKTKGDKRKKEKCSSRVVAPTETKKNTAIGQPSTSP